MKGLIIKDPWITMILKGTKTWEIRGSNTKARGTIALIKSGTKKIYGTVELVDSFEIDKKKMNESINNHRVSKNKEMPYKKVYAWEMNNPILYALPIPYDHPQGAVIWVNLTNDTR